MVKHAVKCSFSDMLIKGKIAINAHSPRSFVTVTGLISVPNIVALGRVAGKVLISWRTPT